LLHVLLQKEEASNVKANCRVNAHLTRANCFWYTLVFRSGSFIRTGSRRSRSHVHVRIFLDKIWSNGNTGLCSLLRDV